MNLFKGVFTKKQRSKLKECEELALENAKAEVLYGGYREPKAPIHTPGPAISGKTNLTDLFNDSSL
ncbi:hypothetical protein [Sphingobacterium athyrii]|uniref:Uncharacterized protein n=1 Tax=Sphingobacterium athyrii TaxID=2152717 RepID=A0A363NMM0_9SPHI|nr:hypothetical protein [Sphingobacterium athyrii]PUV21891.1 hypothetical protein DCO56_23410 [Sphingobacterium athyrii]